MSVLDRLLTKIAINEETGCWNWTAGRSRGGYGKISVKGRTMAAHRVSFELHAGEVIPDGLDVCHRCDNSACVNPDHLFLGTNADNMADKVSKNRQSRASGVKNGRSKLTGAEILAIRSSRETQSVCADRFGVTQAHVGRIRSGEIWRHLGGNDA